jgi:hypothetical protein
MTSRLVPGVKPGTRKFLFSWENAVEEVERVMGIEPTYAAWKAAVLPLNYTRN